MPQSSLATTAAVMPQTVDIQDVADYLLALAHEAGEPITPLKLQKLVYYAQAWHLALHDGAPLVADDFLAWVHGPVARALFDRFRNYQWNPISEPVPTPTLPAAVRAHLDEVMDVYGGYSAWDLERLTHAEEPWIEARAGLPPDAASNAVISRTTMQRVYAARAQGAPMHTAASTGS
jgi:uncharacterized phage-associated protein